MAASSWWCGSGAGKSASQSDGSNDSDDDFLDRISEGLGVLAKPHNSLTQIDKKVSGRKKNEVTIRPHILESMRGKVAEVDINTA